MKKLNILALCALYLLLQSCSKKENSINSNSPNLSKLGSIKHTNWTLGDPLVNGVYWFKNPNGNNCFQVGSTASGALVQENTYIGYPNQQWEVTYLGSFDCYSIINHLSGLAMSVVGSSKAQNAQIDQEVYTGAANQVWVPVYLAWGQYELWNANSGLALTIPGDVTTQFTDLTQTTFVSGSAAYDWQPALIATTDSATVNFGSTTGTMNHVAAGFLHGFTASGSTMVPPDSLTTPLKINTVRERADDNPADFSVIAPALAAKGYKQQINISDSWEEPYGSGNPPGYQGNWAAWDTVVRNVVNTARATVGSAYYNTLEYDIWNEADVNWQWTGTYAFPNGFYAAWKHAYNAIKAIDPNAVIVGPSYGYNTTNLENFLSYCKTNSVVPNYVAWHFSINIGADKNTISSYVSTNSITGISGYQMNEYLQSNQEYAGENAWYMAQIDRAQLNAAMHAIWGSTGIGQLDGVIGTQAQSFHKLATWWVYKAYGDITGSTLTTTPGTYVDLVAGHATSPNSVNMLVGTQSGLAAGAIRVTCNNVGSVFSGRTTLTVTLKVISNSGGGVVTGVPVYYVEHAPVVNNSVVIYIPCGGDQDAYEVNVQ